MKPIVKTASEELKLKNSIAVRAQAENTVSQPGPEDGRDQNIAPGSSHTYEPDNGKSTRLANHNEEVYRQGEDINQYPGDSRH